MTEQPNDAIGAKDVPALNLAIIRRRALLIQQMKVKNPQIARFRLFREVLQGIADKTLAQPELCAAAALTAISPK